MTPVKTDCIFCKIVAGELPSYKLLENDRYIAILDVYPVTKGHTLIIPKEHYRWTYDVPQFGEYWETALKLQKAIASALNPKWQQFFTHGLIQHAHIHIIPRYEEVHQSEPTPPENTKQMIDAHLAEELKSKIVTALGADHSI